MKHMVRGAHTPSIKPTLTDMHRLGVALHYMHATRKIAQRQQSCRSKRVFTARVADSAGRVRRAAR